jgi:membrane fusion protein, copper/silver efflux system
VVKENENNVHFVDARVDGRIDKLYFKTKGSAVSKGQVLYEIYSEMLAATQSEFINNWKLLAKDPDDTLLRSIHQAASQKLLLWGLSERQIEELKTQDKPSIPFPILSPVSGVIRALRISEGSTVMEGQPLFELTEYKSLWVDAQFYAEETVNIHSGSVLDVFVQGASGVAIKGKVVQVLPQVSPSSTVNIVRILINSSDPWVRPGMQADIAWHKEGEKSLIVPSNAVIREAKGNTVWIKNKDEVYEPMMVHIGEVSGSRVEILHGLEVGDEVVYSGAYLLQSEYIFKKGNNPMAGHDM